MSLDLSCHAAVRSQARGVPLDLVEAILDYADRTVPVGGGCESLSISRKGLGRIPSHIMPPAARDRLANLAVIVDGSSERVVTVMHMHGRQARRYRRSYRA